MKGFLEGQLKMAHVKVYCTHLNPYKVNPSNQKSFQKARPWPKYDIMLWHWFSASFKQSCHLLNDQNQFWYFNRVSLITLPLSLQGDAQN